MTELTCMQSNCPKDNRMVDWRVCNKCAHFTGNPPVGSVFCNHAQADGRIVREFSEGLAIASQILNYRPKD